MKVIPALYPGLRPALQSGDVVTFDGDTLLGMAIRHFAGRGSHTAMVLRIANVPERIFLLEALEHGLTLTRMSKRISNYRGRVYVTKAPSTTYQRQAIVEIALNMLGAQVKYDYLSLFLNAMHRVPVRMDHGYCTESVQYILTQAGVMEPQPLAMVPNDFLLLDWPQYELAAYSMDSEGQA